jgi:hypothetical protein
LEVFGSFIDKFMGAIASKSGMKFACRANLLESLRIFLPCFLAQELFCPIRPIGATVYLLATAVPSYRAKCNVPKCALTNYVTWLSG